MKGGSLVWAYTDCVLHLDEEGNTSTRELGLLVARGTLLTSISPVDGSEEIANPFAAGDEDGEGEEPVLA